jgi:hypothetical protein
VRSRAPLAALLILAGAALWAPCAALADVDELYDEYRSAGAVRACAYSREELRQGLADLPADIRAYDPGFVDALNIALEQRAASCRAVVSLVPPEIAEDDARTAPDGSPGPPARAAIAVGATAPAGTVGDGGLQAAGLAAAVLLGIGAFALAAVTRGRRRRPNRASHPSD